MPPSRRGDAGQLVFEACAALARLRTVGDPLAAVAMLEQALTRSGR